MSIGPILPGRIPATLLTTRLHENLARTNRLLLRLQDQIATGQKFFTPSESPAAAIRTVLLQTTIERKEQMQVNVNVDQSLLAATETAMSSVTDALNRAKAIILAGTGTTSTPQEKEALVTEVASLIKGVMNAGNSRFRGRYLFGGSESQIAPFEATVNDAVRYNGDRKSINSFIDFELLRANNVNGVTAFGAMTEPVGTNIDPALSLETKVNLLHGGDGVKLGPIVVTVDDTVNPVKTLTVDLSNAETIGDIKTILEDAFATGAPTLTVDIDPTSNNGLLLTPSGGTVTVTDVAGSRVASDLGIESSAAATINGLDLDPRITLLTNLSDLNNGAGIAQTAGQGLFIVNGPKSATIDISTATTVEDLLNLLKLANLDLDVGINKAGDGLAISSRLSGVDFSIGENGDTTAADLGIRTLIGSTQLTDINLGQGVPVSAVDATGSPLPAILEITRRDGSTTDVDLAALTTVQDVLDAITAVDANLTASLNTVGNGISIFDTSGTGPLIVVENRISTALGLDGQETGTDNTVPLIGLDVHPRQANGVLNILTQLENALINRDDVELGRLDALINDEIERFNLVRSDVGARLQLLDEVENRLLDEEVLLEQTLSIEFDTDLTRAITQFAATQASLEATLRVAASSLQLSLMNFL